MVGCLNERASGFRFLAVIRRSAFKSGRDSAAGDMGGFSTVFLRHK